MNPRNAYVNPLLTNVSVAYSNDSFIADQFFPVVEVEKETGVYFVVNKENLRSPADTKRGQFDRANRVNNNLTEAPYGPLIEHSLETPISERMMSQYDDPFNPKSNATELVTEKLMIEKEKDLVTVIGASGAPTSALTANQWTTAATDIIDQIRTARNSVHQKTLKDANTIIMAKDAYDAVFTNTGFQERIKYTARPTESEIRNAMADFFDVDKVLVGKAAENTAKEGQTDALDYIWKDQVIVAYVAPSASLETPTAGYHLTLKGARYVDEWYEQEIKSTIVRANDQYEAKVIDANAMYVYTDVVA